MTTIEVAAPGMLTTIQDLGRHGSRSSGVGPGGAVDTLSHRVANLLVGNPAAAAALEITLLGPRLVFPTGAWVAMTGAAVGAVVVTADGRSTPVPAWHPIWVPDGATLICGPFALHGCRSSLAVAGGIDVPLLLGGRGTDLRSGYGGYQGRALRAGDQIPVEAALRKPPADRHHVVAVPRPSKAVRRGAHAEVGVQRHGCAVHLAMRQAVAQRVQGRLREACQVRAAKAVQRQRAALPHGRRAH